jgi:uncharacterized protein DUF11
MRILKALVVGAGVLVSAVLPTTALAASTADLSVAVSGDPDPVSPGETITWTITVRNLGPAEAAGVQLVARYGSDAQGISAKTGQGTCTHLGGEVDFSLGTIPSGGSVVATVVTLGFGGDGGRMSVTVSSTTKDPVGGNNSAEGRVEFEPGPPSSGPPVGTFCAPVGGVGTGGGGTARVPLGGVTTVVLLALAGLLAAAARRSRRTTG